MEGIFTSRFYDSSYMHGIYWQSSRLIVTCTQVVTLLSCGTSTTADSTVSARSGLISVVQHTQQWYHRCMYTRLPIAIVVSSQ